MKKQKSKGIIFFLLIAVIIVGAIIGIRYTQQSDTDISEPSDSAAYTNERTAQNSNPTAAAESAALSGKEKAALESYAEKICNTNLNNRLPEFENINDAYKPWIYSHITRKDTVSLLTENEIKEDLQAQFGTELKIEVKKDTAAYSDASMPEYNEAKGKYALPAFGMDHSTYYAVNTIEKKGNQYIINVIEYNVSTDFDTNQRVISAYDESINGQWKWKEIFRTESPASKEEADKTNEELKKTVLNRKKDFNSFNLTVEKNSETGFVIKKSEKA